MTEVEIAEQIARKAHAGQLDKQGQPYILHVERVAAAVSEPAKAAAWLHDVVEDCGVGWLKTMDERGISCETQDVVTYLSRFEHVNYDRHIQRVIDLEESIVTEVKIADLRDNLRDGCPESLRLRYMKALERLGEEPSRT